MKEPPGDPPYKLLQKGNRKKENDNRNVTINEGEHPKWGGNKLAHLWQENNRNIKNHRVKEKLEAPEANEG